MYKAFSVILAATGLLALVAPASATVANDSSLTAPPGVYYGTGNSGTNVHWTVDTETNVELGLQVLERYVGATYTPTGNVYDVPLGDSAGHSGSVWGFAFSVFSANLSDYVYSMSINDIGAGTTVTFDPSAIPDNSGTDGTNTAGGSKGCSDPTAVGTSSCTSPTQKGFQNAETLSYTVFDPSYNSSVNDSFLIALTASNANGAEVGRVNVRVNAGTGVPVPEPTSMMLVGSGLLALGPIRRRLR